MLASMSARQFAEWQAFFSLEPWGYEAESALPSGVVASTIANVHRGKESDAYAPIDFMPYSEREKAEPSEEERLAAIRAMFKS